MNNTLTDGHTWGNGKVSREAGRKRTAIVRELMPEVYKWVEANIDHTVEMGWLTP